MPSAPRERKPALFALAILLVALGAGAAGLLVIRASAQVQAIEVVQQVNENSQIPATALQEVAVPSGSTLNYLSWSSVAEVERDFAAVQIPAGTLLTRQMLSGSNTLTAGQDRVGLSLKAGQVPGGLQPGDMVEAVAVGTACGTTAGAVLAQRAQVTDVSGSVTASGSTAVVTLAVQPADALALTCSAANGNVGLALLPNNG
jgi:hypothetical protein